MSRISDELKEINQGKKDSVKKTTKKLDKVPKKVTKEVESDRRTDTIEFYNSLSETEKLIFNKELQKKKIRDSYINYLKYVYPDFKLTKFHILLANICQSVVEKVEQGKMVRLCISVPPQHGKTTTITKTLPSWFVGRNRGKWAILTAYNADIAEEFSDNNRQLIKQYGKEIFGIETNTSQDNKYLFQFSKLTDATRSVK